MIIVFFIETKFDRGVAKPSIALYSTPSAVSIRDRGSFGPDFPQAAISIGDFSEIRIRLAGSYGK
ncbi:hypothetical protein [Paenibacillus naphthalenovorans]|uniref:hypothetical protein n=1 Tax=Paenibacillus naphthalenovorans TaxID=162209 RepID=UPI003D2DFB14